MQSEAMLAYVCNQRVRKFVIFRCKSARIVSLLIFCVASCSTVAQDHYYDSLKAESLRLKDDTTKVRLYRELCEYYTFIRQDSGIYYATKSIDLAEKINDTYGACLGYLRLSFLLNTSSYYNKSLEMALKGLKLAEQLTKDRDLTLAEAYHAQEILNTRVGNDSIAVIQGHQALQFYSRGKARMDQMNFGVPMNIAAIYTRHNLKDSALFYARMAYDVGLHRSDKRLGLITPTISTLANAYLLMGDLQNAQKYYWLGLGFASQYNSPLLLARFFNNYARFFRRIGNADSCIYYANASLELARNNVIGQHASDAASILAEVYEQRGNSDSALKYLRAMLVIRDSIFSQFRVQQFQLLSFDETRRQRDIKAAKDRYRNQLMLYAVVAAAAIFLFIIILLYRNNRRKQQANRLLEGQKRQIDEQRSKAEEALKDLRVTQGQLIQSEKMASLGELTAGIAHEIQNPLNFVNNFSEVSNELIDEMNAELENNNVADAISIAANVKDNLEKIIHHGKRADAIVKGMLQHSRANSGQKEPLDINALSEEYLRLAYHGLRAKDKSFNANFKTNFDPNIGKINAIPQEIGRVLLNLINNAFYAMSEKAASRSDAYEPCIEISTKKLPGKIEVRINDNGNGIPIKVMDKIFQPFFTTKPSGKGTGLGLSLSYDIITKSHGGEITVESKEGEYTTFIITLPAEPSKPQHLP